MEISELIIKVCALPHEFRTRGNRSMPDLLLLSGYMDAPDKITTQDLESYLRQFPKIIDSWQRYSWDIRWSPSWYLDSSSKSSDYNSGDWYVGYLTRERTPEKQYKFTNKYEACAFFIKQTLEFYREYVMKHGDSTNEKIKIVEDAQKGAEWISQALQSSGYRADFSPESLWQIDFFFEDQISNGKPIPDGFLSRDLGKRLFAIGAYVGEVIRRNVGGDWYGEDADPQAEINIEINLATGGKCWPVQRVMKRFKNGLEDSIAMYGFGLGLKTGAQPKRSKAPSAKKSWWKLW